MKTKLRSIWYSNRNWRMIRTTTLQYVIYYNLDEDDQWKEDSVGWIEVGVWNSSVGLDRTKIITLELLI